MTKIRNLYFLLFSLYWAQGLPVGFMTHALPVILRAQGVSLAHIGGFGLLMLPWSIKIFWAPWVDRFGYSALGHYRSWIIPTQFLSMLILVVLSFLPIQALNQPEYLWVFFIVLLSMNLVGATQDIATDGLAVSILKNQQLHWGNTFQVVGSRLGFIVGGGAVLWALDRFDWQITFLVLAGLVFLNTLPILYFKEPSQPPNTQNPSDQELFSWHKVKDYLAYFYQTPHLASWLMVLISFKIADGLAGPLLKPFMIDVGLSFAQIGIYISILGALAALLGAGLAGLCLKYFSRGTMLLSFSLLKILSLMAYTWLAQQYESGQSIQPWVIYSINAFEDMISAMLLVVMLTLIMQYSRRAWAGTDFTFQVALLATVSGGLYSLSGIMGDILGYAQYLGIITLIAVLCLIPIFKWQSLMDHSSKAD